MCSGYSFFDINPPPTLQAVIQSLDLGFGGYNGLYLR